MAPFYEPVRKTRGKRKGQFAKKKVVQARENLVAARRKSREKLCEKSQEPTKILECAPKMCRIVDLATLAKNLWCKPCNIPLSLRDKSSEQRYGVASLLNITCPKCARNHKVYTHKVNNDAYEFSINSKLAFGMIDTGIGETHVNNLLSAMEIPGISPQLLKKCERKVGCAIEQIAEESCIESIRLEKEKTNEALLSNIKNNVENNAMIINESSETCKITASFDAGWQKRGTGHSYNSLSGHSTLIGYHSGKILSCTVRCTKCRKCSLGHPKDNHDCRANYEGSAKGMEPEMATQLVNNNVLLEKENVSINVLIGDDDSSTIAAVRRLSSNKIEKWSDLNHSNKSLTSALYAMKLSPKLIEYFSHCFSHAVKQNKGNEINVKLALQSVVPHAFGDHSSCAVWCTANESENNYIHKNLPNGKPLNDPVIRLSLSNIFLRFSNNAKKLANCGSTQKNESANSVIASKSPKSRHYSESESLSFRVAASVCQINIGCKYITNVYQKINILAGKVTQQFRSKKDFYRKRKFISNNITNKKRRLQLKKMRKCKTATASRKEGITYETGVSFDDVSAILPNSILENFNESKKNFNKAKIVIFDLETTGLSKNDEICQIAACTEDSSFNLYIIPSKNISKGASDVTGLQMVNGDLYLHDEKVEAFPMRAAFAHFLDYLRHFQSPIILLAHNSFRFDTPRLLDLAFHVGQLNELKFLVVGFSDSLLISKHLLKERCKEKRKFSIQALAVDFLPQESIADLHNAVHDTQILKMLLEKISITDEIIRTYAKPTDLILQEQKCKDEEIITKTTLQEYTNNISKMIINKMAKAGITKQILQETYKNNGLDGIRVLFSENVNGKARITSNKTVLNKIYNLLKANTPNS